MSICHGFLRNQVNRTARGSCCNTKNPGHFWFTQWPQVTLFLQRPWTPLLPFSSLSSKSDLYQRFLWLVFVNEAICKHYSPYRAIRILLELTYSKEYIFTIFLCRRRLNFVLHKCRAFLDKPSVPSGKMPYHGIGQIVNLICYNESFLAIFLCRLLVLPKYST